MEIKEEEEDLVKFGHVWVPSSQSSEVPVHITEPCQTHANQ